MKPRKRSGIVGLKAAIDLASGKAPTSFVLLKYGPNESDYGCFTFDEIAAAMVMTAFRDKGNGRLYADWNHGSVRMPGDPIPTREQGKSPCSFVPIVDNAGNLIASDIQWTDKGREDVESGDYNLFSPAFAWTWGDDDVCRPCELINFALVNAAGLNNIQPLLAASAAANAIKETTVDYERLYNEEKARVVVLTGELTTARNELNSARVASSDVVALGAAVGIRAEAPNAERLTAVSGLVALKGSILKTTGAETPEAALTTITGLVALRADVLKVTGKGTIDEAIGVIEGNKTKAEGYDKLAAESAEREVAALTAQLKAALDRGEAEGKIVKATRDLWEDDALAHGGGKPSVKGIAKLTAKIDASPKVVTMVGDPTAPRQPVVTGGGLLTDTRIAIAKQMGRKVEDVVAYENKKATTSQGTGA